GDWRRWPGSPCDGASTPPSSRSASRPCTARSRRSTAVPTVRKWLWWALQLAVASVVARMVWGAIVKNWGEFRSLHVSLAPGPGWVALAALVVFLTYAIQVESWRRVLAGWAQHLSYGRAARIWLVVNLGRYIPGKVWSVAGLVVLAQRAGVETWAAGASALAMQALGIGTSAALVAAAIPGAASPPRLAAAALVSIATIGFLAWDRAARTVARLVGSVAQFRPLPLAAVAESAGLSLLSWVTYGVAFWLLARGLGLPGALPVARAAGVFALGRPVLRRLCRPLLGRRMVASPRPCAAVESRTVRGTAVRRSRTRRHFLRDVVPPSRPPRRDGDQLWLRPALHPGRGVHLFAAATPARVVDRVSHRWAGLPVVGPHRVLPVTGARRQALRVGGAPPRVPGARPGAARQALGRVRATSDRGGHGSARPLPDRLLPADRRGAVRPVPDPGRE